MDERDDNELLREYALQNSEPAFAALVSRHINLVYSAALRHVGNPHQAEEITQAVFIILAKKSRSLGPKTILSGWLYETTRLTSANFRRSEYRRQRREQEAYMQSTLTETEAATWEHIAPLLDEAMGRLGEADRNAVVLRFFENKTAHEVATTLKLNEAAAHKRVSRALEKLRKFFVKRGVVLSAMAIGGAMAANSVQAAPVGLTVTITATTAKGTTMAASIAALVKGTMKTMMWLKLKFAAGAGIAALLVGGVATIAFSASSTKTNSIAAQSADQVLIVPGASVGKVRKDMTISEVIAALGEPDSRQGRALNYQRLGFSVLPSKDNDIVQVVMCGDSGTSKSPLVKAFKGRTKEGIGMGSSRAEVLKAFGQPTSVKPWDAGQEQLVYKALGLTFTVESGKVFHIVVDFRGAK